MMGKIYGVGVGPGDPELMTLKAVRLIREHDVIAVPGKEAKESVAYKIAVQAVPELADKELVPVYMPMVRDREKLAQEHRKGAAQLEKYLEAGRDVVYLTLGDPTIYCTFSYLQHILEADGFEVELVSGIPSFCAASARLGIPLAEWDEPLHILPAAHRAASREDEELGKTGNYVLMKSASHMREVKEMLRESGLSVNAVSDCGMETEQIYRSVEEIPDDASYFSLIVAKGK
ncbi:MAG: precorrin-2 C(20)-methyltransferase [Eubacteriales bacterium]|nr:precorrin-2 C(20)-methyltransferase [Eubacteriales bacterium]